MDYTQFKDVTYLINALNTLKQKILVNLAKKQIDEQKENKYKLPPIQKQQISQSRKSSRQKQNPITKVTRKGLITHEDFQKSLHGKEYGILQEKLQKYQEAKNKNMEKMQKEYEEMVNKIQTKVMESRDNELKTMKQNKEFMNQWTEKGIQKWKESRRAIEAIKNHEYQVKLLTSTKVKNNMIKWQTDHAQDQVQNIEDFELNMIRLGMDPRKNDSIDQEKQKAAEDLAVTAAVTMSKIKKSKQINDWARKEREIRQRKMLVDQEQTQKENEEKIKVKNYIQKFMKQSKELQDQAYQN